MTDQARLYGAVLYELKLPEDMVYETGRILKENPELVQVLADPGLTAVKKEAVIDKIWKEPEFSLSMASFIKKACGAGCIGQMEDVFSVWEQCRRDEKGILKAQLLYVTEPDEAQIAGIKAFLCREYGKKEVQLSMAAHPELLGGFVLRTGDMEYDYSLKEQLADLFSA